VPSAPKSAEAVLKSLGLRVRELRRGLGITQEQAATKLGMQAPNYARIEQGRVNATVHTLVRIARFLDVSLADLFLPPRSRAVRPGRPRKGDP
jgi:transcriptional regulator with XRE-family HTH domain